MIKPCIIPDDSARNKNCNSSYGYEKKVILSTVILSLNRFNSISKFALYMIVVIVQINKIVSQLTCKKGKKWI